MKMFLHLTILIVINNFANSWRSFNVHLTDLTCLTNSTVVSQLNCSVDIDTKRGGLNVNFKVVEQLVKPTLDVLLAIKRTSLPDFVLINATSLNACNFFANDNLMQMLKLIRDEISLHSTNFPQKCPIEENTNFNINNFYFNANNLPSFVPECNFLLNIRLWSSKELLVNTTVMGAIENKIRTKTLKKKN